MQLPHRVGRYVLEAPLGRGGMAEVYRARLDDGAGFQKMVCIKRVLPSLAGQLGFAEMFKDEAALAARMHHPHLVQALDRMDAEGTQWIVLELVEGTNLKRVLEACRITGEKVSLQHALFITLCITRGLHYAHTATSPRGEPLNVVHRDVSPDNILLGRAGEVKLGDFGVARASERLAARTATGATKGKPGYMAPEMILGEATDHRVDQFALASVLWEMLALRPLFLGKSEMDLAESVVTCIVPRIGVLRKDVPPAVDAALARALSKDPAKRFEDMAAFEVVLARELYARPLRPGDVDVRSLVERTELEDSATVRMQIRQRNIDTDIPPPEDDELADRTSPGAPPIDGFDDKTSALGPSPLVENTVRKFAQMPEVESTLPLPLAPGRRTSPSSVATSTKARTAPMDRRLWIVLGATVAAGAVAASVTAAVAVRTLAPRELAGPQLTSVVADRPSPTDKALADDVGPAVASNVVVTAPADVVTPSDAGTLSAEELAQVVDSAELPADATRVDTPAARAAATAAITKKQRSDADLAAARKLILVGKIEAAVTSLKAIVAAEPQNADAHRMLGVSYSKLRESKRAAAHYKTYLALRPDAPDADAVRAALGQQAVP